MESFPNKKISLFQIIILLIICVFAVGVIVIGLFYVNTIKEQNSLQRQVIENQEREDQAKVEAEETAKLKEEAAKIIAEAKLQDCLGAEYTLYSANWKTACHSAYDQNEQDYNNCVAVGLSEAECRNYHPTRDYEDCSLPSGVSERLDDFYSEAKQVCYNLYGN